MATAQPTGASTTPVRLVFRLGLGDRTRPDQGDKLDAILPLARSLDDPAAMKRVENEITALRKEGLAGACTELFDIARDLGSAGHRFQVFGRTVGLLLFHLAGLSWLDPRRHGLLSEACLTIPDPDALPGPPNGGRFCHARMFPMKVSMERADLAAYLRLRGYALHSTRKHYVNTAGEPGCCDVLTASQFGIPEEQAAIGVVVSAHVLERSTAAISPDEIRVCVEDLAALPANGEFDADSEALPTPVYEEDLMRELQGLLGIGLSDAAMLLKRATNPKSAARLGEWFVERVLARSVVTGMNRAAAEDRWARLRKGEDEHRTESKAHALARAYACLLEAHLKAHDSEAFRASVATSFPTMTPEDQAR